MQTPAVTPKDSRTLNPALMATGIPFDLIDRPYLRHSMPIPRPETGIAAPPIPTLLTTSDANLFRPSDDHFQS